MRTKNLLTDLTMSCLALSLTLCGASYAGDIEDIEIIHPSDGLGLSYYTSDGNPPDSIPTLIEADTFNFSEGVEKVEIAVDGDVGEGTWVGESLTDATATANNPNEWFAVVDLLSGGALSGSEDRGVGIFDSVTVYAFATAAQYYPTRDTTTFDAMDDIDIDVSVQPLSSIDEDENGLPDADLLSSICPPGGDPVILVVTTADGETIYVLLVSIADVTRGGGGGTTEEELTVDLGNGTSVTASVVSPTLATLVTDHPGNSEVTGAENAVLAIALSANAANLVDDDSDPIAEFDIEGAETPRGPFVSVDILLEDTDIVRGAIPSWTAMTDTLVTPLEVEIFGNALDTLTEVFAYYFGTAFVQSDNSLFTNSAGTGWDAYPTIDVVVNDDSNGFEFDMGELGVIVGYTTDVGGGGNGGSCLIANAAFGTPYAEDLQSIRSMRDTFLLNNPMGQAIASTYYKASAVVSQNAMMQSGARGLLWIGNGLFSAPILVPAVGIALASLALRRRKQMNH